MTVQYQGVWSLQSAAQLQSTQRWVTDPLFDYTTLLLQADDAANGAQNNTFLDSSSNNFAITRNGNTTQGSFTPFSQSPGWWSNFISNDGSAALSVPYNIGFAPGSGDFTVEAWVSFTTVGGSPQMIVGNINASTGDGDWSLFWRGDQNRFEFAASSSGVVAGLQRSFNTTVPVVGQWYHVAGVKNGSTLSCYVNGIKGTDATLSTVSNGSLILYIGQGSPGTGRLYGYVSNARIVKGTAVYSGSSFNVPTAPLTAITNTQLLTCQSNRFIDASANNFTISIPAGTPSVQAFSPFAPQFQWTPSVIGGSGYFDGTGDNLAVPTNSANSVGSGSFYFEAWVYLTNPSVAQMIIADPSNTGGLFIGLNIDGGGRFAVGRTAVGVDNFVNLTWVGNQWYHLAVNRNGTSLQFFVNGTQVGSTGTNSNNYPSVGYRIGAEQAGGTAALTGYISGLRLIRSSVNTGNFTPPTAPPTAITNTALLLNFTNAGIYDGTMKNNLETIGNASVSTAVVKYGSGSMAFDGTGDYLVTPSSPVNTLGSGDFTIEFWAYPSNTSAGYRALVSSENYNGTTGGWSTYQNGTAIEVWLTSGQVINATSVLTATTWQHIALSRASGTVRLFVNGTSVASASSSAEWTGQRIFIGDNNVSGTDYFFNGYLDDIRITRGIARYTQNFIPPSVALPRQ